MRCAISRVAGAKPSPPQKQHRHLGCRRLQPSHPTVAACPCYAQVTRHAGLLHRIDSEMWVFDDAEEVAEWVTDGSHLDTPAHFFHRFFDFRSQCR